MARDFVAASEEDIRGLAPLTATNTFTVQIWFNPDDATTKQSLISEGILSSSTNYWYITKSDGGSGTVDLWSAIGGVFLSTSNTFTAGTWNHALLRCDASGSGIKLNDGTEDTGAVINVHADVDVLAMGQLVKSATSRPYDGQLAEAAIWDVRLNDDEVSALAAGASPLLVRPANLIFYCPIYGEADPEPDIIGGLTMDLTATPTKAEHPPIILPGRYSVTRVAAGSPLTQLTLDADGTIGAVIQHDAGTGTPFYTHANDAPDGLSADYVENDTSETTGEAWFRLSDVDTDFDSMDTFNIDVDVIAQGFSDDTCALTARIFAADNDTGTPLTAETGNLATEADTTRTQRNVVFASLTGTEAQWNGAYIRFTWTYSKTGGPDNATIRLFGCDIDGTYTVGLTPTIITVTAATLSSAPQSMLVSATVKALVAALSAAPQTVNANEIIPVLNAALSAPAQPMLVSATVRTLAAALSATPQIILSPWFIPVLAATLSATPQPVLSSAVVQTLAAGLGLAPQSVFADATVQALAASLSAAPQNVGVIEGAGPTIIPVIAAALSGTPQTVMPVATVRTLVATLSAAGQDIGVDARIPVTAADLNTAAQLIQGTSTVAVAAAVLGAIGQNIVLPANVSVIAGSIALNGQVVTTGEEVIIAARIVRDIVRNITRTVARDPMEPGGHRRHRLTD